MKIKNRTLKSTYKPAVVDGIFLEKFLTSLDIDELRLYLICLQASQNTLEYTPRSLAQKLQITEPKVKTVLGSLEQKKLLQYIDSGDPETSLIEIYNLYDQQNPTPNPRFSLTPEIESFLRSNVPSISSTQLSFLTTQLELGFSETMILLVLRYVYIDTELPNFRIVQDIFKKLQKKGIFISIQEAIEYLDSTWKREDLYEKVHELLTGKINPNGANKKYIDSWLDDNSTPLLASINENTIYEIVCKVANNVQNPTYNYLDKHFRGEIGSAPHIRTAPSRQKTSKKSPPKISTNDIIDKLY